jgi:Holliday junction DNA helicase RuvA
VIGKLSGTLTEKSPGDLLLETGGVGYRLTVPLSTFGRLPLEGQPVSLHIHTHVREDQIALYGFDSREERDLFERLLGISGIGPRLALAVLSHMEPEELAEAAFRRDTARLTRVPGIGAKTAERLVIDLADRLRPLYEGRTSRSSTASGAGQRGDLLSALLNLGYRQAQVAPVIEGLLSRQGAHAELPALLKEALRTLAPAREERKSAPATADSVSASSRPAAGAGK